MTLKFETSSCLNIDEEFRLPRRCIATSVKHYMRRNVTARRGKPNLNKHGTITDYHASARVEAGVCLFSPPPGVCSRFSAAVWSAGGILRDNESHDDDDRDGGETSTRTESQRAAAAVRGLYGYLNTFAINSRERALEARSRRAMRRSFSLFAFSFCARLSSCLLARSVCTYSSGVSRLSAGSRLVSAARVPRRGWRGGFQPAFEKREQQTASRKERGGCRRSRWRARSRRNKAAINKSHGGN